MIEGIKERGKVVPTLMPVMMFLLFPVFSSTSMGTLVLSFSSVEEE